MQRAGLIDANFPVVKALAKIIDEQVDKDAMSPADVALKALQTSIVSFPQHFHHLDKDGDAETSGYGDAFGWYDKEFTYIRTDKIVELAGGSMTSRAITKALDEADVLHRAPGKNIAFSKVGKLKVQHYKIDRSFSHGDGQDTG